MRNTRTINAKSIPTDYKGLMEIFPLRPIRDDIDLDNSLELVDCLAVINKPTADQADYLDVLSIMIEAYERDNKDDFLSRSKPIDRLKFLLNEHKMSGSDLGRKLGNRTVGSAILRGERSLSRSHIQTLARYFGVNPGLFLSP